MARVFIGIKTAEGRASLCSLATRGHVTGFLCLAMRRASAILCLYMPPAVECVTSFPGGLDAHPACCLAHHAYGPLPAVRSLALPLENAARRALSCGLGSQKVCGLQGEISEARTALRGLRLSLSDAARTAVIGLVERQDESQRQGGVLGLSAPIADDSAIYPTGQNR